MPPPAPSCAKGGPSHPDGTEVDPGGVVVRAAGAIADAGGLDDVEAWAIGGQQHGMVVLDDAEGRVIRPALLWNDTRSAGAAADLIAEFGAEALAQRTGLVPVASFTITKLRWLRDHEPENAARVAAVALPHDWLTWRLRGFGPEGESPRGPVLDELVTDRSDASGTGYWDPATGGYDRDLLVAALGHDAVAAARARARRVGRRTRPAAASAAGAGDNAGAALGLGAGPGDVVVSIGTSGTVFAVSEQRTIDPTGTVAGLRRLHRAVPAARRDPQRRPGARCDRADCWASTTPSSAGSPSPPSPARTGSRSCRTSRASAPRTCPMRRHPSPA